MVLHLTTLFQYKIWFQIETWPLRIWLLSNLEILTLQRLTKKQESKIGSFLSKIAFYKIFIKFLNFCSIGAAFKAWWWWRWEKMTFHPFSWWDKSIIGGCRVSDFDSKCHFEVRRWVEKFKNDKVQDHIFTSR